MAIRFILNHKRVKEIASIQKLKTTPLMTFGHE